MTPPGKPSASDGGAFVALASDAARKMKHIWAALRQGPMIAGLTAFCVTFLLLNMRQLAGVLAHHHSRAIQQGRSLTLGTSDDLRSTFERSRGADARAGSGRAATPTAEAQKRAPAVGALPPSLDIATRPASPAEQGGPCGVRFHSEFWGDVVRWGADHKVSTWQECCAACQEFVPGGPDAPLCNVWVWCGDERLCGPQFHECWLKHLAHPTASRPRAEGDGVGWTSGLLPVANDPFDPGFYDSIGALDETDAERKYHYVITAQGQATHWQARINYFWWRVMKAKCLEEQGDACQMGTYTRLLHSGQPDDLVDEIPTFVVDPIPPDVENTSYVVLNRPFAIKQWTEKARITERYVLMAEPDHILLRPLPNRMRGQRPFAFPFFYIAPNDPKYQAIARRFVGDVSLKELEKIAPVGNAPTFLSREDLQKVAPAWYDMALDVYRDKEANKEWGWVQEMYAFAMTCYEQGLGEFDLDVDFMAQPPFDEKLAPFDILHYTFGQDFDEAGRFVPGKVGFWHWDKRDWSARPPPVFSQPPPAGCQNELTVRLVEMINRATGDIECWDEYHKSGAVHYKDAHGVCMPHRGSGSRDTVGKEMVDPTRGAIPVMPQG